MASLISNVLGTQLPGPGSIFVSQSVRFMSPVYIDDTIEVVVEAVELNVEKNRMSFKAWGTNQNDVRGLEAEDVIMPPKRPKPRG